MPIHFLAALDALAPAQHPHVGGKAACCARLLQAGIDVPAGFILCVEGPPEPLPAALLDEALAALPGPGRFAVRSSGADEDGPRHSFAGIHESVLDVPREGIPEAVARCWHSFGSARAAAYRASHGLRADGGPQGILVQRMVPATVSGVAFTRDPLTGAADAFRINAVPGRGDRLMDGNLAPDEMVLRRGDGAVLESRAPAAALAAPQVAALWQALLRVEAEMGSPQDVEWCFEGGRLWIVQSRPVTATAPATREIEWTRANVREVLPDLPSPQALQGIHEVLLAAMRLCYGRLLGPEDALGPPLHVFLGRPYFNLTQLRHLCRMTGSSSNHMLEMVGHAGALPPEENRRTWPSLRELARAAPPGIRLLTWLLGARPLMERHLAHGAAWLRRVRALDLAAASDARLLREVDAWRSEGPRALASAFSLSVTTLHRRWLGMLVAAAGLAPDDTINVWLAAGPKTVSAQQALDLLAVAATAREEETARRFFTSASDLSAWRASLSGTRTARMFEAFLAAYGHRGVHESDWALPRYREDPTPLLAALRAHLQADAIPDPAALRRQQEAAARRAWEAFGARLRGIRRVLYPRLAKFLLGRVRQMYLLRERNRFEMIRVLSETRRVHLELARRLIGRRAIDQEADYFWLEQAEIRALIEGAAALDARRVVAERKAQWERWRAVEMPLYMKTRNLDLGPSFIQEESAAPEANGALHGQCVSPGCVEAEVVVLREPGEFARMRPGAILVAPATDPSWTPLFTLAVGVIVEIGGSLSHASTIARELSLPALANVRDATRRLRDGDRVRLDATRGKVELLEWKQARP